MNEPEKHRVVIIGGGFGGLWATRSLANVDVDITLIDKQNFHLFQPLLYQVATGAFSAAEISSPLRSVFARHKNIFVKIGKMISVDFEDKRVILKDDELFYDNLIVDTGAEVLYYGKDELRSVTFGLKSIEDALQFGTRYFAPLNRPRKNLIRLNVSN